MTFEQLDELNGIYWEIDNLLDQLTDKGEIDSLKQIKAIIEPFRKELIKYILWKERNNDL